MLQGNINLIQQAAKSGVKKFVLVTSIGTGDSKDAPPEQVYNVLKPVLEEKTKAENVLKVGAGCDTDSCHFLTSAHILMTPKPICLR